MLSFNLSKVRIGKFGQAVIAVVAGTGLIVAAVSYTCGVSFLQAAPAVGSLATALAVFLALLTLRNAHEWNRRHYTIEFMVSWNDHAREHLVALEREFPEFFSVPDFIKNPGLRHSWCLDGTKARQLVKSETAEAGSNSQTYIVRDHLIALLNYFEDIAIAYEQHVVDRSAIEDSFAPVILDVCTYFQPFIDEIRKINRRDPWPPLSRVVELWLSEASRRRAQEEAQEASERYRKALKKAEEKLKEPTGV
jgi:hypothetical protein